MFVKMKDESLKCCNETTHKVFGGISPAKISKLVELLTI